VTITITRKFLTILISNVAFGAKNGVLGHLYIKMMILPRQARDKHRENSKKADPFCYRRPPALSDAVARLQPGLQRPARETSAASGDQADADVEASGGCCDGATGSSGSSDGR
jgi:hypothetical protein